MNTHLTLAFTLASATLLPAQLRVDYPDSVLASPPELLFPFYTIHGGGTVRYQTLLPSTFPGLPTDPMLVTKVGVQIAGQAAYDRFEIRFGTTAVGTLTNCFTTNLPDQQLQNDMSGQVLSGGLDNGMPANEWVEFDLEFPFLWRPGDSLVLDIVSSAAVPGQWCLTGVGPHNRLYQAPYAGEDCGVVDINALKVRAVFEPVGFPAFGAGCPGAGGFEPSMSGSGSSRIGGAVDLHLSNANAGAMTFLMAGLSRSSAPFGSLPLVLGGGCELLTSAEGIALVPVSGSGPGQGTATAQLAVPNDPSLQDLVVFAQWAQLDGQSPAFVPVTVSNGISIFVY